MATSALATAFVNIVPGTKDIDSYLKNKLGDGAEDAGREGGRKLGAGLTGGFKGALVGIGAAVAALGIANMVGDMVRSAEEGQKVDATLANITKSMGLFGKSTDTVVNRLQDLATAQMRLTGVDDDVIKGAQAKLMTFAQVAQSANKLGGAFDQATKLSLDLAAAGFGSVDSAAVMLGKALNDPVGGVTALRRVGVQLTEQQQEQIEAFVAAGDAASAQAVILAEVERQVGGTAEASATASAKMKARWDDFTQSLGELLLPALAAVTDFLTQNVMPAVEGFATWAKENPGTLQALATSVGVLAGGFLALAAAMWVASLTPITLIIAAIIAVVAALVAGIVILVQNWDTVVAWVYSVFGPAFEWVGGVFTWLYENIIKPVFDAIGAVIGFWWNYIALPIFTAVGIYIAIMAKLFEFLYKNVIKPVFEAIGVVFGWLWENIIRPWFERVGSAVELIGSVFRTVFGAVGNFVRDTFNSIVGFVRGPINAIIDLLNGMIGGLNKIKVDVPPWVPVLGGQKLGFNIPKIPKLAEGGFVTSPTMALIGEAGPEVVTPLRDFERMMGVGNGSGKTINYYAAPNQSIDSEQALAKAIKRAEVLAAW